MSRFQNLDTHLIDTSKSYVTTKEFQNLNDKDVVAKIPTSGGGTIVFIVENDNLYYANFKNLHNEVFDGNYRIISEEVKFDDKTNVKVFDSFYEGLKLFFVFYNKGNDLFVRTFHNETFLGEELLIAKNVTLNKIERIKENYVMSVLDNRHAEIFSKISQFGDGEYKLIFLYESDIMKFEGREDSVMNIQLLDIPFNDIGENTWTNVNSVNNEKGFLYITNPNVISVFNEKSINGSVFRNPGRVFMEMNRDTDEYVYTARFSVDNIRAGFQPLFETENYRIEFKEDGLNFKVNGEDNIVNQNFVDGVFYTLSVSSHVWDSSTYILKLVISSELKYRPVTINLVLPQVPEKFDSIMTIYNVLELDYISIQNYSLQDQALLDIHSAFNKRILKSFDEKTISLSHNDFNGFIDADNDRTDFPVFEPNTRISGVTIKCNTSLSVEGGDSGISDEGNGIIVDNGNNMMFGKNPYTVPVDWSNMWRRVNGYVEDTRLGRYNNWRLPTLEEMVSFGNAVMNDSSILDNFNLNQIKSNPDYPGLIWTSTKYDTDRYYFYDLINFTYGIGDAVDVDINNVFIVRSYEEFSLKFGDGKTFQLPTVEGEEVTIDKAGWVNLIRNVRSPKYLAYDIDITYKLRRTTDDVTYGEHYRLNNTYLYRKGTYFGVDYKSNTSYLRDTVFPFFIDDSFGINTFSDKEDNIRVCENLSQKNARVPFKLETAGDLTGFVIWAPIKQVGHRLGLQYELQDIEKGLVPVFHDYSTLEYNCYPNEGYFCAYHFTDLLENRNALITELVIDNQGEIILGGNTRDNTYLREINTINFFDSPKKYKTSEFDVEIDVLRNQDRESYINNVDSIRLFVSQIVDLWKPATANARQIIEKETLVMANLLKDEFTQVLVGITPKSNVNAYYIRSVESGQLSVVTSSNRTDDLVDWIGIGTTNTPYLKSGVTKIKGRKTQTKIFFETRFQNAFYRIFVFSPNNVNYFVSSQDRDGFIVESSAFVEDEVAWIAVHTNQAVNGTINWAKGLPDTQKLVNHLDRQQEVNINSSRYTVDFKALGFPEFEDNTYSVILSADTNVNVWVENKTTTTFDIRRSYAGNDSVIHFLALKGSTKWWEDITA